MKINKNYLNLQESYLFSTIAHKVNEYKAANPQADVIRLGIGDVTQPLCPAVIRAMHDAVNEMGKASTFKGYGPEQGYEFLKSAVAEYYNLRGVMLENQEIFISDGAKSDLGNILDLFSPENTVLVPDPVYPVYVDTNMMDGRNICYMNANESNGFLPLPDPDVKADIIYLCSPTTRRVQSITAISWPSGSHTRRRRKLLFSLMQRMRPLLLMKICPAVFTRSTAQKNALLSFARFLKRLALPERAADIRLYRWSWCARAQC